MLYTLKDIVDFCYKNRKRHAFTGNSYETVCSAIIQANKRNKLTIVDDGNNNLIGMAISTERPASRVLFIDQIICTTPQAFNTLILTAFTRYPGYKIQGNRKGKLKTYTRKDLYGRLRR